MFGCCVKKGEASSLHIIILDEIDAICKQRGSVQSGTGVTDSVVNQLLSKIDGVDSLNNILLIGMTNRLDMIDEALLRPGRLEVHIEIGLPDFNGRKQILGIHTDRMRQSNRLSPNVSLSHLADRTRNFSGAELAGLIRSAASYAFTRNVDVNDISKPHDTSLIQLCQADFDMALEEVKPAFGVQTEQLSACLVCGIIEYGHKFNLLRDRLCTFAHQVRDSTRTPLLSCLLVGEPGAGKTALAAHIGLLTDFPFIKLVSPEQFVGFTEFAKVSAIKAIFEDAYKSELSLIILDNLERLMDYTAFGHRFSNMILQALLVLVKRLPTKKSHRLFIVATSSEPEFMQQCGVATCFNVVMDVPLLSHKEDIRKVLEEASESRNNLPRQELDSICAHINNPISIKKLLLVYEMATENCQEECCIRRDVFINCLDSCGEFSSL